MSAPHASDFEVRVRNTAHGQPRPYAAHTYIDEIVIVTYKQFGHARHSQAMVLQMAKGVCGGYVEEEQGDWASMRLVGLTKLAENVDENGKGWSHWRYHRQQAFTD